jgi:hypothetical protein
MMSNLGEWRVVAAAYTGLMFRAERYLNPPSAVAVRLPVPKRLDSGADQSIGACLVTRLARIFAVNMHPEECG